MVTIIRGASGLGLIWLIYAASSVTGPGILADQAVWLLPPSGLFFAVRRAVISAPASEVSAVVAAGPFVESCIQLCSGGVGGVVVSVAAVLLLCPTRALVLVALGVANGCCWRRCGGAHCRRVARTDESTCPVVLGVRLEWAEEEAMSRCSLSESLCQVRRWFFIVSSVREGAVDEPSLVRETQNAVGAGPRRRAPGLRGIRYSRSGPRVEGRGAARFLGRWQPVSSTERLLEPTSRFAPERTTVHQDEVSP